MMILKNGHGRLAFQFGRASALRSTNDTVDQLQTQLDALRMSLVFSSQVRPPAVPGSTLEHCLNRCNFN
jgi:hypothetical protein